MSRVDVSEQEWQIACVEVKQRGAYLLRTGLWSDCTFLVGPDKNKVQAHRLILTMASPVFLSIFTDSTTEDNNSFTVTDINLETFLSLLAYIYSDEIKIESIDDACDLLAAAHKYMLPHVVKECASYITSNITGWDACRVYELARLYNQAELMDYALTVISQQTNLVFISSYFSTTAELSTLTKIFSLKYLDVDSELDLLDAAERFVQYHEGTAEMFQSSEELSIRSAVKQIRFLTLTTEQFAERETGLLTDAESLAIMKNLSSQCTQVPMPSGFTTSRESRTKSRRDGKCRLKVRIDDTDSVFSEYFSIRGAQWVVWVEKDYKLTGPKILTVTLYNVDNIPCTACLEILVLKNVTTKNVITTKTNRKEFHKKTTNEMVNTIVLTADDIIGVTTVILEVSVRTFSSMDEAISAVDGNSTKIE